MSRVLVIGGLAALLVAGAAVAQPAPPPGPSSDRPAAGAPGRPGFGPGREGRRGPGMRGPRGERPTPEQVRQRTADMFAQMDANRDGRATFEEFRAWQERQRVERQRRMFQRFSGGQDYVTLEQLNQRATERMNRRGQRPGDGRQGQ